MKGRVLFVLLLHVALASTLSGCRTADVAGGQAAHRAALQALSSGVARLYWRRFILLPTVLKNFVPNKLPAAI